VGRVAVQPADVVAFWGAAVKFSRSLSEAFACERYAACFGPYKRRSGAIRQAIGTVCVLGLFCFIGALIGASF
jgi:hypothetical protein